MMLVFVGSTNSRRISSEHLVCKDIDNKLSDILFHFHAGSHMTVIHTSVKLF